VCDFSLHNEESYTLSLTRFHDHQGNLVRVEAQVDISDLDRKHGDRPQPD
jgi:hypothetical protein